MDSNVVGLIPRPTVGISVERSDQDQRKGRNPKLTIRA